MTRKGKIARLPRDIRNELNQRLSDGEQGKLLVEWLNGHPEVQEALALYFEARPVTEQNLSEWKQGGYEDWVRHQESLEWARLAADEAAELEEEGEGVPLSDRLSALAAVVLGKLIRSAASAPPGTPQERRQILDAVRELTALRVSDHRAARLKMDLHRWNEEEAEIEKRAEHKAMWDPLKQLLMLQNHRQAVATLFPNLTPDQQTRLRALLKMPPSPPSP